MERNCIGQGRMARFVLSGVVLKAETKRKKRAGRTKEKNVYLSMVITKCSENYKITPSIVGIAYSSSGNRIKYHNSSMENNMNKSVFKKNKLVLGQIYILF